MAVCTEGLQPSVRPFSQMEPEPGVGLYGLDEQHLVARAVHGMSGMITGLALGASLSCFPFLTGMMGIHRRNPAAGMPLEQTRGRSCCICNMAKQAKPSSRKGCSL
jgi:hypothetical protein